MTQRSRRVRLSYLAAIAATLCLGSIPSEAAQRTAGAHGRPAKEAVQAPAAKAGAGESKPAEEASARTEPMGVWTSGEQDRACFRSRRKLWQDGQGWVVKRVSICP